MAEDTALAEPGAATEQQSAQQDTNQQPKSGEQQQQQSTGQTLVDQGASQQDASGGEDTSTQTQSTEQGEGTPWYKNLQLDEETIEKGQNVLDKYQSPEEAIKGLVNAQEKLGKKGLPVPDENASDEEKQEFRQSALKALGLPDDPSEYEWSPPEEVELDSEKHEEAKQKLHELGLTKDQFQGVMDLYAGEIQNSVEQAQQNQEQERKETTEALREEWGDEFDKRLDRAQKQIQKAGLGERLKELGLGNNKEVLKMFEQAARATSEDSLEGRQTQKGIDQQINDLKASDEYKNVRHPQHQKAVDQLQELYKQKVNPGS